MSMGKEKNNYDFWIDEAAKVKLKNPSLRWGQCLFNTLYQMDIVLADTIRGTEYDCFYDNSKCQLMMQLVKEEWEK